MRLQHFSFISFFFAVNCQLVFETDQVLQLIANAGYQGEAHQTETDDGYILKIHRIIPKFPNGKEPVFIMHGILATSADFLVTGSNVSIAYLLSDHGYDVWLGKYFNHMFQMITFNRELFILHT